METDDSPPQTTELEWSAEDSVDNIFSTQA